MRIYAALLVAADLLVATLDLGVLERTDLLLVTCKTSRTGLLRLLGVEERALGVGAQGPKAARHLCNHG